MHAVSAKQHPASTKQDDELVRGRRALGDLELIFCSDGTYLLDGGAMFGVVPKPMWEKRAPADEANRILLGLNTVVVRTGGAVVLIETGIGNKQPAKMKEIHQNQERLPASLAAAGVRLDEVTHVINTHLHFDHCGWNTTLGEDGVSRPTFPNARYFAAAGELAHGRLQLERDRVSYLGPNYDPLIESGQLTLIDPGGKGGFTAEDAAGLTRQGRMGRRCRRLGFRRVWRLCRGLRWRICRGIRLVCWGCILRRGRMAARRSMLAM